VCDASKLKLSITVNVDNFFEPLTDVEGKSLLNSCVGFESSELSILLTREIECKFIHILAGGSMRFGAVV
jgi:hypothetical protein